MLVRSFASCCRNTQPSVFEQLNFLFFHLSPLSSTPTGWFALQVLKEVMTSVLLYVRAVLVPCSLCWLCSRVRRNTSVLRALLVLSSACSSTRWHVMGGEKLQSKRKSDVLMCSQHSPLLMEGVGLQQLLQELNEVELFPWSVLPWSMPHRYLVYQECSVWRSLLQLLPPSILSLKTGVQSLPPARCFRNYWQFDGLLAWT